MEIVPKLNVNLEVEPALVSNPSYIKLYDWEMFDFPSWRNWMKENWHLSVVFTAIYVILIFVGKKWMVNRPPFQMRNALISWNALLAIFSIVAFVRTVPEMLNILSQPNGFHKSVCSREGLTYSFAFWALMGTFSKVAELGDTIFVVLRKQRLIFLHWYHHATVMLYTWFTYEAHDPTHRWFMTMNYFVHSFMYTYFGLRAAGVKLPRKLAMVVTALQILQMIVGITVNWHALNTMGNGEKCDRREKNIYLALTMYATYFMLFADFFYKAYFKKSKKP